MSILNPPEAHATEAHATEAHATDAHATEAPDIELQPRSNRLFTFVAIFAMIIGIGAMLGGIAGATFTYQQAAAENIVTPDDAFLAEVPVRGPLSMYAQSDIITFHQLERTEGLRYAEMDREVPLVDEAGAPVLDEAGEPVMGPNDDRLSWIDATALTTVLNLGIMAYALAAFAFVVGATLALLGLIVLELRRDTLAF